ncbi:hypothetical protein DYB32_005249 [Aphanomyces invadans]|uniref:CASTOR/POLLUX/SYM8 ion channel conserved domain-containing protein n=1 Tax=Aphanomyces invadans TaxID=157072 RepID=A0A3R7CZZ6_9STRA|nr:hypothetical protein DYB32_005249 [Aphanomyces invadans]
MAEAAPVEAATDREEVQLPPPPLHKFDPRNFSLSRVLYNIDTFISTKKGQTAMLVGFGLFLMIFCGLFYSLIPRGVIAGKHVAQTTSIEGDMANISLAIWTDGNATAAPTTTDVPSQYTSIIESIWACWLFIADPGAQNELHEWNKRVFAFFVSLIGMVYFFVIMGFVVDSIRDKMEDLKKGRSNVIEKNHSLLLGWSDKSVSLVKQLCLANESEGGGVVVVLAEIEKERIEAELESQMEPHEYHGTKVVVRSGSPLITNDLKKVSAHTARSITIMATSIDADKSDASCLRVILSLRGLFKVHHVTSTVQPANLSCFYNSVLGFDGDEFYTQAWPEVVGVQFGELIARFPAATPIGVKTTAGKIVIKPSMTYKIEDGDEIIVLAEDNDTYKPEPPAVVLPVPIPVIPAKEKAKEKILVCGWRRDIQDMLVLLDSFVERGSEVHLLNELTMAERDTFLSLSGVDMSSLENCEFLHFVGNTSVRRYLEPLPLEMYTSIMVLCDFQRELDILNSDSHSLATKNRRDVVKESLFAPRVCEAIDRWTRHASNKCPCITEILDPRTQKTVVANSSIASHSDFVMSNELISCMLAMISESREVKQILSKLLSPKSNTFTVQLSSRYCTPHEELSYFQLAERLVKSNELLVGYISKHDKNAPAVLNPKNKAAPVLWRNYDLIVITGGSAIDDRHVDVKRAVVESIEATQRKNMQGDETKRRGTKMVTGLVAANPPDPKVRTRRSVTKRNIMLNSASSHEADVRLTPEVRRKLSLLYDEVQGLLRQYNVVPTMAAQKYAVQDQGMKRGSSAQLVTKSSVAEAAKATKEPRNYSYSALIAYKVDTFISTRRGQTISLVTFGSVFTLIMALIMFSVGDEEMLDFDEALWNSWMYMTFPGAQRDANGWLLLGWTDKSVYLIRELCRANESEKGGVVVVLAEMEKEYLEAELHSQMSSEDFLGTKVVFRSGNPLLIIDLLKVSAHTARSIVIMATLGDADKSDASVLRIILSLLGLPYVLFSSVLGFEGNEFYISEWPQCVGVPFGQLPERFRAAVPIGIETTDGDVQIKPDPTRPMEAGESIVFLAEDNDTYKAEETAIAIPTTPPHALVTSERQLEKILMCGWRRDIRDMIKLLDDLVLRGSEVHLLCEDPPIEERDKQLVESGMDLSTLVNIELIHQFGNSAIRRHVDQLPLENYTSVMVLGDQSREMDILHSDSHSLSTVLLLRGLQAARKRRMRRRLFNETVDIGLTKWMGNRDEHISQCPCITEILDPRTQKTIASNKTIASHSEFIQSNELVSCMLAMISESRKVKKILNDLLGATGCSFQVEPSVRYCDPTESLSFFQVAKRALVHDEVLCGYQGRAASDSTVLNPSDKDVARTWKDIDFVIIRGSRTREVANEKLIDSGAEAFQDAARHRHVADLVEKNHVEQVQEEIAKSLQVGFTSADNRVVEVTKEVLQRLSVKLSVILKECEQHKVA